MPIKRYQANADNTITNVFKDSTRATGSNMGLSDVMEIFCIYGEETSTSVELSRGLISFPISSIVTDRSAGVIPASGSVNFILKMYNAEHASTLPRNYTIDVNAVSGSWQEGNGLDLQTYLDLTNDSVGSNWINANNSFTAAAATITISTPGNLVADTHTIRIITTDETVITATVKAHGGTTTTTDTNSPTFAIVNGNANSTAANLKTCLDANSKLVATVENNIVTVTQATAGKAGNTIITLTDPDSAGMSKTDFKGGNGKWATAGGDYFSDTSSSFDQNFFNGEEDMSIDITTLVEQWMNSGGNVLGSKLNHGMLVKLSSTEESATTSTYTKMFFGRTTEYFFKRPVIEARWESGLKDDRNNFYYSSSLATAEDNLNTIYLYNYIRGKLQDIPSIAAHASAKICVSIFSGSSDNTEPYGEPLALVADGTHVRSAVPYSVTGSKVSTGIYKAVFAYTGSSTLKTIYDVWFSSSNGGAVSAGDASVQFHTGSITPLNFYSSNINPNGKYVVSMPNLKSSYSTRETERFRLYIRNKNWSPTVYTKSKSTPETLTIQSASYQIVRIVDQTVVIPHGTGSSDNNYSLLSYDISGNYFDFDLSMLESGYTYGFQFSFYEDSVSSYRQQPYLFKFKVENDEY